MCAVKTLVFHILSKKKYKNIAKNYIICLKREEKTVKEVKMHTLLVCAYRSQDFAQNLKFFARLHDRENETSLETLVGGGSVIKGAYPPSLF